MFLFMMMSLFFFAGVKDETGTSQPFNIAVAELGGHIPMYGKEYIFYMKSRYPLQMESGITI